MSNRVKLAVAAIVALGLIGYGADCIQRGLGMLLVGCLIWYDLRRWISQ